MQSILDKYNELIGRNGVLFFTYKEYSSAGDLLREVNMDEPASYYSLSTLQDLLSGQGEDSISELAFYGKKGQYNTELWRVIYPQCEAKLLPSIHRINPEVLVRGFRRSREREQVLNSVTYHQLAEYFQEDLARQEQSKQLQELKHENEELRLRLKDQEEQESELNKARKKAQLASVLTGIGTHVVSNLILQRKHKIAATVQGLAGIPKEAIVSILSDEEEPTQGLGNVEEAGANDEFINLYHQLGSEDKTEVYQLVQKHLQSKYASAEQEKSYKLEDIKINQ